MGDASALEKLTDLLEHHRAELQALPGVVGSGIGLSREADEVNAAVIQVFVARAEDRTRVSRSARAILGTERAEVVVVGEVRAGGDPDTKREGS